MITLDVLDVKVLYSKNFDINLANVLKICCLVWLPKYLCRHIKVHAGHQIENMLLECTYAGYKCDR